MILLAALMTLPSKCQLISNHYRGILAWRQMKPQTWLRLLCLHSIFKPRFPSFLRSRKIFFLGKAKSRGAHCRHHCFLDKPSIVNRYRHQSARKAIAASLFDAIRAGMWPPRTVRIVLIRIRITACTGFNCATFGSSVMPYKIALIGNVSNQAMIMPSIPELTPRMMVSASKTRVTSFRRAPNAFKTPISLVR